MVAVVSHGNLHLCLLLDYELSDLLPHTVVRFLIHWEAGRRGSTEWRRRVSRDGGALESRSQLRLEVLAQPVHAFCRFPDEDAYLDDQRG